MINFAKVMQYLVRGEHPFEEKKTKIHPPIEGKQYRFKRYRQKKSSI